MTVLPNQAICGLVAGEASGDMLGAHLMRALAARRGNLQFEGVVGPRMLEAGAHALYPSERLAVNGLADVLVHLPGLLRMRSHLVRHFQARRPAVFVGIDAPDFNFGLEARLKAAGIPTVHFVSPSLWAWRPERIEKIRAAVSRMLVVFPFEEEIYERAGIPVSYVGHPLADELPLEPDMAGARRALGVPEGVPVVALLPGSRMGEVQRLAPVMLEAAQHIRRRAPDAHFILAAAPGRVSQWLKAKAGGLGLPLTVTEGRSIMAMTAADVVLLASGTATLEAALLKKPMVIAYILPWLTKVWVKNKLLLPYVGLPNILSREFVVPEMIQDQATPKRLAAAVLDWLEQPARCSAVAARFAQLHATLRCNAAERIADALLPYL